MEPLPAWVDRVGAAVVHAAFAVHNRLGAGLLESAYEVCLAHELKTRGIQVRRQVAVPVIYGEVTLEASFRLDMLVGESVIVELKAVDTLLPVHTAQILTYLKLSGFRLGYLINFNVPRIKDGIKRVVL